MSSTYFSTPLLLPFPCVYLNSYQPSLCTCKFPTLTKGSLVSSSFSIVCPVYHTFTFFASSFFCINGICVRMCNIDDLVFNVFKLSPKNGNHPVYVCPLKFEGWRRNWKKKKITEIKSTAKLSRLFGDSQLLRSDFVISNGEREVNGLYAVIWYSQKKNRLEKSAVECVKCRKLSPTEKSVASNDR